VSALSNEIDCWPQLPLMYDYIGLALVLMPSFFPRGGLNEAE